MSQTDDVLWRVKSAAIGEREDTSANVIVAIKIGVGVLIDQQTGVKQ